MKQTTNLTKLPFLYSLHYNFIWLNMTLQKVSIDKTVHQGFVQLRKLKQLQMVFQ